MSGPSSETNHVFALLQTGTTKTAVTLTSCSFLLWRTMSRDTTSSTSTASYATVGLRLRRSPGPSTWPGPAAWAPSVNMCPTCRLCWTWHGTRTSGQRQWHPLKSPPGTVSLLVRGRTWRVAVLAWSSSAGPGQRRTWSTFIACSETCTVWRAVGCHLAWRSSRRRVLTCWNWHGWDSPQRLCLCSFNGPNHTRMWTVSYTCRFRTNIAASHGSRWCVASFLVRQQTLALKLRNWPAPATHPRRQRTVHIVKSLLSKQTKTLTAGARQATCLTWTNTKGTWTCTRAKNEQTAKLKWALTADQQSATSSFTS